MSRKNSRKSWDDLLESIFGSKYREEAQLTFSGPQSLTSDQRREAVEFVGSLLESLFVDEEARLADSGLPQQKDVYRAEEDPEYQRPLESLPPEER